jgi:hypothetical protein
MLTRDQDRYNAQCYTELQQYLAGDIPSSVYFGLDDYDTIMDQLERQDCAEFLGAFEKAYDSWSESVLSPLLSLALKTAGDVYVLCDCIIRHKATSPVAYGVLLQVAYDRYERRLEEYDGPDGPDLVEGGDV